MMMKYGQGCMRWQIAVLIARMKKLIDENALIEGVMDVH
jgi:hypothetical protein